MSQIKLYPTNAQFGSTLFRSMQTSAPAAADSNFGFEIGTLENFISNENKYGYTAAAIPSREIDKNEFLVFMVGVQELNNLLDSTKGNAWVIGPLTGFVFQEDYFSVRFKADTAEHASGTLMFSLTPTTQPPSSVSNVQTYDYQIGAMFPSDVLNAEQTGTPYNPPPATDMLGSFDASGNYYYLSIVMKSPEDPASGASNNSDIHFALGSNTHFGTYAHISNPARTNQTVDSNLSIVCNPVRVKMMGAVTMQCQSALSAVKLEYIPGLPAHLSAQLYASSSVVASVGTSIKLAASLASSSAASGLLRTMQYISAAVISVASVYWARMATAIKMALSMHALPSVQSSMRTDIKLSASMSCSCDAELDVTTGISMSCAMFAESTSSAVIATLIRLNTVAATNSAFFSELSTQIRLACELASNASLEGLPVAHQLDEAISSLTKHGRSSALTGAIIVSSKTAKE